MSCSDKFSLSIDINIVIEFVNPDELSPYIKND